MLRALVLFGCVALTLANHNSSLTVGLGPTSGSTPPQPPASGCTTLVPVFGFPSDGTSTVFATTVSETTTLDCRKCTPTVRTFNFIAGFPVPSPTTTITRQGATTSYIPSCLPTKPPGPTVSSALPAIVSTSAAPVPTIAPKALKLINELRTVNLYVLLIANGGFEDVLCSALNPPLLSNNTGINGTVVQNEVCFVADIQAVDPALFPFVVQGNQIAAQKYVEIALYAVQVAAGYGGIKASKSDIQKLCDEIEETALNGVFGGYIVGEGTVVKDFVCNAAK